MLKVSKSPRSTVAFGVAMVRGLATTLPLTVMVTSAAGALASHDYRQQPGCMSPFHFSLGY